MCNFCLTYVICAKWLQQFFYALTTVIEFAMTNIKAANKFSNRSVISFVKEMPLRKKQYTEDGQS